MKKINILYTFAFLCILTMPCTKSYAAAASKNIYNSRFQKRSASFIRDKRGGEKRLRYYPERFKVTGLFKEGVTIVDVGAGNGVITQKLVEAHGKDNVYAVEPDPKHLSALTEILDADHIFSMTLQDAYESGLTDVDAMFMSKYNVPLPQKEDFWNTVVQMLNKEGTVQLTSVERERLFKTKGMESLYLRDTLERHFEKVSATLGVRILDESGREVGLYDKAKLIKPKK
tara:strand:+ start:10107 stop:10793 length:687 start_codon:yes stop_codon:yes gene_type:complete